MAPMPEGSRAGYHAMWNRAAITAERAQAAAAQARQILTQKYRYRAVEALTGVPAPMVAVLHTRESSRSFSRHLHNGDSLSGRTRRVPAGRPKAGKPPFTFEQSAQDALTMPPHALDKVKRWSCERILYECERYNGWGYLGRTNSPYLWSWTTEYKGGKYIRDHVFDPKAWDPQPGCAALLKALAQIDPDTARLLTTREPTAPADVLKRDTRRERKTVNAGAGGAVIGSGAEAAKKAGTVQPTQPVVHHYVTYSLIGVGVAMALVGAVLVARKTRLIKAKWG